MFRVKNRREGYMDCCKGPNTVMGMGQVVCPKPRRPVPANFNSPSMVLPFPLHIRDDAESKPVGELLGAILKEDFPAERCANLSSSPPFFFGSPPCRIPNPIVQDAHFRSQKLNLLCKSPTTELATSPKAIIRVEGFDCPSPRVVAMA